MSNNLVTRMQNAVNDANTASNITYQVLTGSVNDNINVDGLQVPTLNKRIKDYIDGMLGAGDLDGEDGASIEYININEVGELLIKIEGQNEANLGKIVPDDGIGIESLTFDPSTGTATFVLDDGRNITLNNLTGDDGISPVDASIVGADLVFTMSDGSEINAGNISRFGGISASDAEINEAGELVIIFSDGTTETIGQVLGPKGNDGVSTIAGYYDAVGVLRFYKSDGSQYNVGQAIVPILDASQNTVEGARLDGKSLVLELSSGDYPVGQIVGDDGTNGIDGVSVVEVYINDDDNQLYVRLTGEDAKPVGEVRNTIFENSDVSITEASVTDGKLYLDINVNGVVQEDVEVGDVAGADGTIFNTLSHDPDTNTLSIEDVDGNVISVGNIEQNTIASADVDTETRMLNFTLSNGDSISAGVVRGEDGIDGVDGIGIADIYIDPADNNLYVRLDGETDPTSLGTVSNTIFEGASVSITNASIDTDGVLNMDIDVNGTVQTEAIGTVVGADGTIFTDMNFDATTGVLSLIDGDGNSISAGTIVQNSVESADVDTEGNLTLTLTDESTVAVTGSVKGLRGQDGVDGVDVESVYIDDTDNNLYVKLSSDANAQPVGKVQNIIFGNAELSLTTAEITDTGELVLDINNNGTVEQLNVGSVKGDSGTVINNAAYNETTQELTFDTDSGTPIIGTGFTQNTVVRGEVDQTTGELKLYLRDNEEVIVGKVKGQDGDTGVGVKDAYVVDGKLFFVMSDSLVDDIEVGNIMAPVETGAVIDSTSGNLIITLSDGQDFDLGPLRGDDGITIASTSVNKGELSITLNDPDATQLVVGDLVQRPTASNVLNDGKLQISFSDGSSVTTDKSIRGLDGDTITNVEFDSNNRDLVFDLSTDNLNTVSKVTVPLVRGRSIENLAVDDVERKISFNTNVPDEGPYEFTVREPVDGLGIETIDNVDNVLTITLTDPEMQPLEIPLPTGKSIQEVNIDSNDNLEFVISETEKYTLQTIEGYVGYGIDTASFDGQDLVFIMTDGEEVRAEVVRGQDGDAVTDVTIDSENEELVFTTTLVAPDNEVRIPFVKGLDADILIESINFVGNDLVITTNQASPDDAITIPAVRGLDGNSVTGVSFIENDLVITTNLDAPDDTITIPAVRGLDGNSITGISFVENDLVITTNMDAPDDTITIPAVRGLDGNSVTGASFVENDLVITTNLDAPDDTITIPAVIGVDGLDGRNIASATIDPTTEQLVITLDDTDATEFRIDGVGVSVTGVSINAKTGLLDFDMSDGTTMSTTTSVIGRDGNGVGIDSVTFTDGQLDITLIDAAGNTTPVDAGSVSMVSVSETRIDENTDGSVGELVFVMSDGSEYNVGNVYGRDGRYVESVEINADKHLLLNMSNGDVIDAGYSRGEDGRSVDNVQVLFSGDLLVSYDDGTTGNAGSIGSGAGLTVWNIDNVPYVKDRVVIHDGGLYMSKIDGNSDQPPSSNWTALALGDQIIEIRKPSNISPINAENAFSKRPTLVGSKYAAIVSIDERDYREFQVAAVGDTDFATIIDSSQLDSDTYQVGVDLTVNTNYIWRCRDVSKRGYESAWSDATEFMVPDGVIAQPTVTIDPEEDAANAFMTPRFIGSDFLNEFDTSTHNETDWRIMNADTDAVVYESLADTTNLTSIIVPPDVLSESTTYNVMVRYRSGTIESPWSDPLQITTQASFEYVEQPVIFYDGDISLVSATSPTFNASDFSKTASFLAESANIPLVHVNSDWEVVNADTGDLVEDYNGTQYMESYTISTPLTNNVNYRIRVKYNSDRFGSSQWSEWLDFSPQQTIEKPVVSTTNDVNGFLSGGTFDGSEFVGVNDTHVSTDWEVRNFNTDVIAWESLNDTTNLTSITFDAAIADDDYKIRIRYNGNDVVSEWSEPLSFYYGTPE